VDEVLEARKALIEEYRSLVSDSIKNAVRFRSGDGKSFLATHEVEYDKQGDEKSFVVIYALDVRGTEQAKRVELPDTVGLLTRSNNYELNAFMVVDVDLDGEKDVGFHLDRPDCGSWCLNENWGGWFYSRARDRTYFKICDGFSSMSLSQMEEGCKTNIEADSDAEEWFLKNVGYAPAIRNLSVLRRWVAANRGSKDFEVAQIPVLPGTLGGKVLCGVSGSDGDYHFLVSSTISFVVKTGCYVGDDNPAENMQKKLKECVEGFEYEDCQCMKDTRIMYAWFSFFYNDGMCAESSEEILFAEQPGIATIYQAGGGLRRYAVEDEISLVRYDAEKPIVCTWPEDSTPQSRVFGDVDYDMRGGCGERPDQRRIVGCKELDTSISIPPDYSGGVIVQHAGLNYEYSTCLLTSRHMKEGGDGLDARLSAVYFEVKGGGLEQCPNAVNEKDGKLNISIPGGERLELHDACRDRYSCLLVDLQGRLGPREEKTDSGMNVTMEGEAILELSRPPYLVRVKHHEGENEFSVELYRRTRGRMALGGSKEVNHRLADFEPFERWKVNQEHLPDDIRMFFTEGMEYIEDDSMDVDAGSAGMPEWIEIDDDEKRICVRDVCANFDDNWITATEKGTGEKLFRINTTVLSLGRKTEPDVVE